MKTLARAGLWWIGAVATLGALLALWLVASVLLFGESADNLLVLFPLGIGTAMATLPGLLMLLLGALAGPPVSHEARIRLAWRRWRGRPRAAPQAADVEAFHRWLLTEDSSLLVHEGVRIGLPELRQWLLPPGPA